MPNGAKSREPDSDAIGGAPCRTGDTVQSANPPETLSHRSGSKGTILVAEDSAATRRFVTGLLEDAGYTVLTAGDGAEALSLVRRHASAIHLVLTDIEMPRMGGLELAAAVRELFPSIGIVLMSGTHDRESLSGPGAVSFLDKPFAAGTLLEKIRTALGNGTHREAAPGASDTPAPPEAPLR
jgi:CheY-like chemotaxis protein